MTESPSSRLVGEWVRDHDTVDAGFILPAPGFIIQLDLAVDSITGTWRTSAYNKNRDTPIKARAVRCPDIGY
jgi:hypothetical protein